MGEQQSGRLDSWKSIAEYLRRDVRTVMRWAKDHGLPVHRVTGGKGRSVFAYRDAIDLWLTGRAAETAEMPATDPPALIPAETEATAPAVAGPRRWIPAIAVLIVSVIGIVASRNMPRPAGPWQVTVGETGVVRAYADGTASTIHAFDPARTSYPTTVPASQAITDLDADGAADVLVAISYEEDVGSAALLNGRFLRLDPAKGLQWAHVIDDPLTFGKTRFEGPWAIVDWRVSPGQGSRRIAVAAHHFVWWPGLVALLDPSGRRIGTFVNTGWIEGVRWIDAERVLAAGFSNPRDGGMVAVLDTRVAAAHSPEAPGEFTCQDCPPGDPLHYVVFPRSELNRRTGARFNRAQIVTHSSRYVVQTEEVRTESQTATAVYEFDRNFNLVRGTYSDTYWDEHRRLELEGSLDHPAAACPTRSGPPWVDRWSRATGWQRVAVPPGIPGG